MAQFRTTADILDLALTNGGEVTSGTSSYESQLLNYLNRVHYTLVAGGSIPVGNDTSVTIDEVWPWAKARSPLVLELQPKYTTGTVTFTQGSESASFSAGPASSLQGWYIRIVGKDEYYRIAQHTAAATAFELDGAYTDDSGSGLSFEAYKLDYDLIPDYLVVDSTNDKIQVQKVAGSTLTGTLTHGTYTPSALATHVAAVATTALSGPTITGSYSAITRLFTLTSDLAGATIFRVVGNGDQAQNSIHKTMGYDDVLASSAAAQTSTYVLGGICRIVEPFKRHKGSNYSGSIFGIDAESFQRDYPFALIEEGQPDKFAVVRELPDGTLTVRFNRYPTEKTRFEIEYVPVPRDLKDDAASIPLVPRKHIDVLEDAATFYLMLNKNDDRAQIYASLMQGKIKAMVAQHRGSLLRSGEEFGRIVPRRDLLRPGKRRLIYGDRN